MSISQCTLEGDKNVHEGYKHIKSEHFRPKMVTFNKYDSVQWTFSFVAIAILNSSKKLLKCTWQLFVTQSLF
jgi:hypothetical protein